jgi:hypothetical protein
VLFSHEETARWLESRFEAAWRTLRPVPLVTVDFGDGRSVTRTLHGNVVTWVCTPDGEVVDGLPGLYDPAAYRARLEEIAAVAARVGRLDPAARRTALDGYHRSATGLLTGLALRPLVPRSRVIAMPKVVDSGKSRVEFPLERALPAPASAAPAPDAPGAEDGRRNEGVRRPALHRILLAAGAVRPGDVERRVYREVLHADLDDPWLGLAPALFDPGDPLREAHGGSSVADGAPALDGLAQRGR